jgi:ABC-type branched-subunit amino acid transport system substrate-binding protein
MVRTVNRERTAVTTRALAVLVTVGALLAGGCQATPYQVDADPAPIRLYGSDGNMSNGFGAAFKDTPGMLNGMRGTAPLTPVSEDMKRRLKAVDPKIADFNYAGEAYDAVVIAALAAETARGTEGPQIARYITAVTVARSADTAPCETVRECLDAIRAGRDVAYRGATLRRSGLTEIGEPSTASYGTLSYGRTNQIDDGKTEFVAAGDETKQAKDTVAPPTRLTHSVPALKIGALLPHTGDLASFSPPLFAGAQLGVREVNEAGGVLGKSVEWVDGDDGTDPKVALATAERHIANGVQVIIGAAASGITKAVLPTVTAAGRVLISPSATSDELSQLDDHGLFFRTSPPDDLQAKALVDVIMRYGAQRVVIVAREDSYGRGLRSKVEQDLRAAGVKADQIKTLGYEVRDSYTVEQFAELAAAATDFKPDAVLVVGFDESANVIKALSARGMRFHS